MLCFRTPNDASKCIVDCWLRRNNSPKMKGRLQWFPILVYHSPLSYGWKWATKPDKLREDLCGRPYKPRDQSSHRVVCMWKFLTPVLCILDNRVMFCCHHRCCCWCCSSVTWLFLNDSVQSEESAFPNPRVGTATSTSTCPHCYLASHIHSMFCTC